jgi:hypothetical protein
MNLFAMVANIVLRSGRLFPPGCAQPLEQRVITDRAQAAYSAIVQADEQHGYKAEKAADDRGYSPGRKLKSPDARANKETRESQSGRDVVSEPTRRAARDGNSDNIQPPFATLDRNAQSICIFGAVDQTLGVHTAGIGWCATLPTDGVFVRHDRSSAQGPPRLRGAPKNHMRDFRRQAGLQGGLAFKTAFGHFARLPK